MDLRESAYCFSVLGPDVMLFWPFIHLLYHRPDHVMSCLVLSCHVCHVIEDNRHMDYALSLRE